MTLIQPAGQIGAAQQAVSPALAMWVWDVRHISSPSARDRLLKFCRENNISSLYLAAYEISESQAKEFRAFNRSAHAQGVQVHALAGDPRWALARYHKLTLAWLESVLHFNEAVREEERFDGVHTDIEPYLLSKMWNERPALLLGGFLDLHAKIAERLGENRTVHLGVDVPFWYDDDPAYIIEWRGAVKAPSHHIIDMADTLAIMAYRNYAAGADGVIAISRNEIDYAEQVGKSVMVGQETQTDLFPAYITYGGTTPDHFRAEVEKVTQAFSLKKSFGGIAIHHYDSYEKFLG